MRVDYNRAEFNSYNFICMNVIYKWAVNALVLIQLIEENSQLAQIEKEVGFVFIGNARCEVLAYDAVPCGRVLHVEFPFDDI